MYRHVSTISYLHLDQHILLFWHAKVFSQVNENKKNPKTKTKQQQQQKKKTHTVLHHIF